MYSFATHRMKNTIRCYQNFQTEKLKFCRWLRRV